MSFSLEKGLSWLSLTCLSLLILQTAVPYLPDIILLKYLTTTRLILLLGLSSIALTRLISKRQPGVRDESGRPVFMFILIMFLLLWYGASSLVSTTSISLSMFRLQLEEIIAFLLVFAIVRDRESLGAMMTVFLVAALAGSLHSINQFVNQENTNFFIVNKGIWTSVESITMPEEAIIRVTGYFNNPNMLASYLVMLIPIAALSAKRISMPKWLTAVFIAILAAALLLTFSRGAVIALLLALGITLLKKKRYIIYAVAPLIAFFLINPISIDRASSGLLRFSAWGVAIDMVLKRPLFGVGLGNFRAVTLKETPFDFWHAHNLLLNIAAEAGIVASLLFLAIFVTAMVWALRLSREEGFGGYVGLAFSISLIGFSIVSMVDDAYNIKSISYAFWLLLGLLASARSIFAESEAIASSHEETPPAIESPDVASHAA